MMSTRSLAASMVVMACGAATVAFALLGCSDASGIDISGNPTSAPSSVDRSSIVSSEGVRDETDEDPYSFVAGYDPAQMFWAVEAARADFTANCLSSRGFDASVALRVFDNYQSLDLSGSSLRPVASSIQRIVDGVVVTDGGSELSLDPDTESALWSCTEEAQAALPNPNDIWLAMIADLDAAIADRTSADDRVIAANVERNRCIAETGYTGDSPDGLPVEPRSALALEAQVITSRYQRGEIGEDTALADLRLLLPIEERIADCDAMAMATLLAVRAEYWKAALDENVGLVQEVQDALANEVKRYEQYLTARG